MKESKDNLELWNKVEKTNPEHTKEVTVGRKFTAINATRQIKEATTLWGKYGHTWCLENIELDFINELANDQILCIAKAIFKYPDGSFEIGSSIMVQSWVKQKYHSVDSDFVKKVETDMLTKALSKLGFNADVFFGLYDDNKYINDMKQEFKERPVLKKTDESLKKAKQFIESKKDTNETNRAIERLEQNYTVSDELKDKLREAAL